MAGFEPEDVIDGGSFTVGYFREGGWFFGFFPCISGVIGSEDGGSQVAGFGGYEQCFRVSRIEDHVVYDVTEEEGAACFPAVSRSVGGEYERAFFGGDKERYRAGCRWWRGGQ
jgi:hypothetical protein